MMSSINFAIFYKNLKEAYENAHCFSIEEGERRLAGF